MLSVLAFVTVRLPFGGRAERAEAAQDPTVQDRAASPARCQPPQPGAGHAAFPVDGTDAIRLRGEPDGRKGAGGTRRARPVRDRVPGLRASGRRPGPGVEGPSLPARESGTDCDPYGRRRAGRDPAHLDGREPEPRACPAVLLGRRGDALDRGPRAGFLRRRPRDVRAGELAGRRGQPPQRDELLLADAVPLACEGHAHERIADQGPRSPRLPDHYQETEVPAGAGHSTRSFAAAAPTP